MERTKQASAQKNYYILKDNIYVRVITAKDLKRIDQIASIVNSAYVKDGKYNLATYGLIIQV